MRSLLLIYILLNSLSNFAQSNPPPANDSVVWFPEILEHSIKWHPIKRDGWKPAKEDPLLHFGNDTSLMVTRTKRIIDRDSIIRLPAKNTTDAYERFTGKPVTHNFNCGSHWEHTEEGIFLEGWDKICCMCRPKPKTKKCIINKTKDYYISLGNLCKKCGATYGDDIKIIVHSGDSRMKKYKKTTP